MASPKLSIKLLIDTASEKVLFAESGKDFIDFLFSLLALPVGTVVRLLTKQDMVGSLGNLYKSIENLDETYIRPNQNKDVILKPRASFSASELSLLMQTTDEDLKPTTLKFFMCIRRCNYRVSQNNSSVCPTCMNYMNCEVEFVGREVAAEGASSSEGGFVKDLVTYMVMDDLVVQPMSTISCITLLNKFNVKEVGVLQEKIVHLGMAEGLKLLKASLTCKSVLTSVFLNSTKEECELNDVIHGGQKRNLY